MTEERETPRSGYGSGLLLVAAGAALLIAVAVVTWRSDPPSGPKPHVVIVDAPLETTAAVLELRLRVEAETAWVDLSVGEQTTRVAPGEHALQVPLLRLGLHRIEVRAVDAEGRRSASRTLSVQRN